MNRTDFLNVYWNYYLIIENDFINLTQYVKLNKKNYKTTSNEIIKLLLNIGSEFDTACKILNLNSKNISDHYSSLINQYPKIKGVNIKIRYEKLAIKPFYGWCSKRTGDLFWWKAYNDVKHNRFVNYNSGNFKNLLYSLAALYFTNVLICKKIGTETYDIGEPYPKSKLFEIANWKSTPKVKKIIFKEKFPVSQQLDIGIPYYVGKDELNIYYNGEKLIRANKNNNIDDGHFIEVGRKGMVSHFIQFYKWGEQKYIEPGEYIEIRITRDDN